MEVRRDIFISYSHKDEDWKDRLLRSMIELGVRPAAWNDRDIVVGSDWYHEIMQAIDQAKIGVLLLSEPFFASDFIRKHELRKIKKRAEQGELTVYPILVSGCSIKPSWIRKLQIGAIDDPLDAATRTQLARSVYRITHDLRGRVLEPLPNKRIKTDDLPTYGSLLFGREKLLNRLDTAWSGGQRNIVSLIAEGGVGKTTLVARWLRRMDEPRIAKQEQSDLSGKIPTSRYFNGAESVFCFSFYSQGSNEKNRAPLGDIFLAQALRFFGGRNSRKGQPSEQGERLAELVGKKRALVVLDGMEPLQHPPGKRTGELKDPGLRCFLERLVQHNEGLCVITSRQQLTDLTENPTRRHLQINLENLQAKAGADLLHALKVVGPRKELMAASREFGGHALALNLLGTYLWDVHNGDVTKRSEIDQLLDDEDKLGIHARKVIQSYVNWYRANGNLAELDALNMMGLFDREATPAEVAALRGKPPISGLTSHLSKLKPDQQKRVFGRLRDARLLFDTDEDGHYLDAHPLVREFFANRLKKKNKHAWREGHARLYQHLKAGRHPVPAPRDLEDMKPWLLAVSHGCNAGMPATVFHELYRPLIERDERYLRDRIGAVSTNTELLDLIHQAAPVGRAEKLTKKDEARVLSNLSIDARMLGELPKAIEYQQRAAVLFEKLKDRDRIVNARRHLAQYFVESGDFQNARNEAENAVRCIDNTVHIREQVSARCTLASILYQMGETDAARAEFERAELDQANSNEREASLLHRLNGIRYCELLLGDRKYKEVIRRIRATNKTCHNKGYKLAKALNDLLHGKALIDRGSDRDLLSAEKHIAAGQRLLRELGDQTYRSYSLLLLAELKHLQGKRSQAKRCIEQALDHAKRFGVLRAEADARLARTRQLVLSRRWRSAEMELEELEEIVNHMSYFKLNKRIRQIRDQIGRH